MLLNRAQPLCAISSPDLSRGRCWLLYHATAVSAYNVFFICPYLPLPPFPFLEYRIITVPVQEVHGPEQGGLLISKILFALCLCSFVLPC